MSTTTMTTGPAQAENAWAGRGAVLLDIGGDVGALVVSMPEEMTGLEVEIRAVGSHDHHDPGHHEHDPGHHHLPHVAVVPRPVAGGLLPSLVFGELVAGRYELFEKGHPGRVALEVTVAGAAVTRVDWPA